MTSSIFLKIIQFNCLSVIAVLASLTIQSYPLLTKADSTDDYLNELEAEARNSANVQKVQKGKSSKDPSHEKIKAFTKLLKFERPMTFRFFLKLDKNQQQSIVDNFTKHKKISRASKKIFDLYFAKN